MPHASIDSPVGPLCLHEEDGAIIRLSWQHPEAGADETRLLREGVAQLHAYFAHELRDFDLPLVVRGSAFQQKVCAAMSAIPLGETRTYGDLAGELGAAAQPVGNACGANPIPVIIPCHRVLGANGLGGFSGSGGVETKVALLRHEGAAGLLI
ncbi:methylated-DNA--[protein]-cysteine S-methyltransferase [Phaeobacter italicus]|uniref:methylated-DNA--[protein]-cysteine S-methyltransferase n=1 Tax=Phaeobacter italicus TaxID=481446 RepID=UPI0035141D94